MKRIELFTGYRDEDGVLSIKIVDTDIGCNLPKEFWEMIIKNLEIFKNDKNYINFEKEFTIKADKVIKIIKKSLEESRQFFNLDIGKL